MSRSSEVKTDGDGDHFFRIFDHERYPYQSEYLDLSPPIKRYVARCHERLEI